MYKKITHNITEEHFHHPTATQIKKAVDKISPNPKPKMQAFETSSSFRNSILNYFTDFLSNMNSIVNCIKKPDQDLQAAQEVAFATVEKIGDIVRPYYGFEFAQQLNSAMSAYILTMANYVRSLNIKTDTYVWGQKLDGVSGDVAMTLGLTNSLTWQWNTIKDLWKTISDSWVAEAKALLINDTNAYTAAKEKSKQTLTTFIDMFITGVTLQHPDYFLPG